MGNIKYLVKPGYVKSRSDGDEHYISFHQLCELYRVNPAECMNLGMADMHGYHPDLFKNLPVLEPRYDGNYATEASNLTDSQTNTTPKSELASRPTKTRKDTK